MIWLWKYRDRDKPNRTSGLRCLVCTRNPSGAGKVSSLERSRAEDLDIISTKTLSCLHTSRLSMIPFLISSSVCWHQFSQENSKPIVSWFLTPVPCLSFWGVACIHTAMLIWEGPVHCGQCWPTQAARLEWNRKACKHGRSKPVSNAVPWSLHQFLPQLPWMMTYKP